MSESEGRRANLLICITGSVAGKLLYKIDQFFRDSFNVQYVLTDAGERAVWDYTDKNYAYRSQVRGLPFISRRESSTTNNDGDFSITGVDFCYHPNFNIWLNKQSRNYNSQMIYSDTDSQYYINYGRVLHVDLAHWADKILICPCTENTLVKIANGICDNLVTCVCSVALGLKKPMYIAPAMNNNMYQSFPRFHVDRLISKENVTYIPPTVDKLECGDFGIGSLAYIGTIYNIVCGTKWKSPLDWDSFKHSEYECYSPYESYIRDYIPRCDEPGCFGAVRKHDIHTGVDLYCNNGSLVKPVECGEVVDIGPFTGKQCNSPWWEDTDYVIIKGKSGYVLYGEIQCMEDVEVGYKFDENDWMMDGFAHVKRVLKPNKKRKDIRNHSTSMLHIELYKEQPQEPIIWNLGQPKDSNLLDPTPYLFNTKLEIK